jgi:hypothetical protein
LTVFFDHGPEARVPVERGPADPSTGGNGGKGHGLGLSDKVGAGPLDSAKVSRPLAGWGLRPKGCRDGRPAAGDGRPRPANRALRRRRPRLAYRHAAPSNEMLTASVQSSGSARRCWHRGMRRWPTGAASMAPATLSTPAAHGRAPRCRASTYGSGTSS